MDYAVIMFWRDGRQTVEFFQTRERAEWAAEYRPTRDEDLRRTMVYRRADAEGGAN